ncbi:MAG TPA: histidine ammonia-lyase [Acidobacteriota bacterium]|nr:histidine ammonia-lyase [Acidobacteriota bacterium]
MGDPLHIGNGSTLTLADLVRVARSPRLKARLSEAARREMKKSSRWVDGVVERLGQEERPSSYYGINTGFGALAGRTTLDNAYLTHVLSRNLLASHAAGAGSFFEEETVRAALLLRAHSLAQGHSGVRVEVVEKLLDMLNRGLYPAVPCMGSLGASGDLAPLSHLALLLAAVPQAPSPQADLHLPDDGGEAFLPADADLPAADQELHLTVERPGGVQKRWRRVPGRQAMEAVGGPLELRAKEGLALNNGTAFSTALLALALHDAQSLVEQADLALAMTLEAILGFGDPFFSRVHEVRGHPGAAETAAAVRLYTQGSTLIDGSPELRPRRIPPQDPYSLRCAPQVHGAVRDTLAFVRRTVDIELNATTDNPLIFPSLPRDYKAVSGGNFHGEPVAMASDFLSIAVTELGSIAERRVFKMTDYHPEKEFGLPPFLFDDKATQGLNSGLMIPQYTAASLVSDCKTLSHPDCVDSIPSSADQEDHVSMSLNAARHARQVVDNIEQVVAIEFLCAGQALEWRQRQDSSIRLGAGSRAALDRLRQDVPYLAQDRVLYPDLRKALQLVRGGQLLEAARQAT